MAGDWIFARFAFYGTQAKRALPRPYINASPSKQAAGDAFSRWPSRKPEFVHKFPQYNTGKQTQQSVAYPPKLHKFKDTRSDSFSRNKYHPNDQRKPTGNDFARRSFQEGGVGRKFAKEDPGNAPRRYNPRREFQERANYEKAKPPWKHTAAHSAGSREHDYKKFDARGKHLFAAPAKEATTKSSPFCWQPKSSSRPVYSREQVLKQPFRRTAETTITKRDASASHKGAIPKSSGRFDGNFKHSFSDRSKEASPDKKPQAYASVVPSATIKAPAVQQNSENKELVKRIILQRRRARRTLPQFISMRKAFQLRDSHQRSLRMRHYMRHVIPERHRLLDISARAQSMKQRAIESEWDSTLVCAEALREELGAPKPTDIQALVTSRLLRSSTPLLMAAPTGSGKTIAFLTPIVHRLKLEEEGSTPDFIRKPNAPRAVVVVPSHELVEQVTRVAKRFSHRMKLRCVGAASPKDKLHFDRLLASPIDLLVGTPGQLVRLDGHLAFTSVRHFVIDEGDTVLMETDFMEAIHKLFPAAQLASMSTAVVAMATVPKMAIDKAKSLFPSIKLLSADGMHRPLANTRHHFIRTANKLESTIDLLRHSHQHTVIFCHDHRRAERLYDFLSTVEGINPPSLLHGGMTVSARKSILAAFSQPPSPTSPSSPSTASSSEASCTTLVCTDLAARGWDTPPHVRRIIQFDFAGSLSEYLHRAGRVGRTGHKKGARAISLIGRRDKRLAEVIQMAVRQRHSLQ